MNPYCVTITGADDRVPPISLDRLAYEFPFVEWGILYSFKRVGTSRYPSGNWMAVIGDRAGPMPSQFSLHLCGKAARETTAGHAFMSNQLLRASRVFRRMQINGYEAGMPGQLPALARELGVEFILQCRHEEDLQQCARDAETIRGASVLFDPSGGRGIESFRYPPTPLGCRLGFAGGIGPDNVLDVIRDIGPRDPYWIDMESGVRTDDNLDLTKVRRVLEQIATLTVAGKEG